MAKKRTMPAIVPATPARNLDEIRDIVRANKLAGDFEYMGLDCFLMFGEELLMRNVRYCEPLTPPSPFRPESS